MEYGDYAPYDEYYDEVREDQFYDLTKDPPVFTSKAQTFSVEAGEDVTFPCDVVHQGRLCLTFDLSVTAFL